MVVETEKSEVLLDVNNIEVIYNHVILVLKGVSLAVPKGGIVALLGGNGAGKTTTLKAISNLLNSERGEVTKGFVSYRGAEIHGADPADMVKRGVIQVMEGRHCFEHLTVEENLLTGAYTRSDSKADIQADLDMVYTYFPRLKERRKSQAGYTSGGEQQMVAIARALSGNVEMILMDEPFEGLSPTMIEELFESINDLRSEVSLLIIEHQLDLVLALADRAFILDRGVVSHEGPTRPLLEDLEFRKSKLWV